MNEYPAGSECVGCGYCCLKAMCLLGAIAHGKFEKKCPFLIWDGTRYLCSNASDPVFAKQAAIGTACSSTLGNTWRKDIKFRG